MKTELLREDERDFAVLLESDFQSSETLRECSKRLLSRLSEARGTAEREKRQFASKEIRQLAIHWKFRGAKKALLARVTELEGQ